MKLAHVNLENTFIFDDERMISWLIENSQTYYKYVRELVGQVQGEIGNFVLSDKGKTVKIESDVQIINGPFDISFNSKKISTMISKRLLKLAVEGENTLKLDEVSKVLNDYFSELLHELDLPVETEEFQEDSIVKAISVKAKESLIFYENLINYISLVLNLFNPKLLVIVNIKPYVCGDDFEKFMQFLMYEDINVLFVDFFNQEKVLNFSKTYFLDYDNCEFEYQKGEFTCK